jgi:hypothetical protein
MPNEQLTNSKINEEWYEPNPTDSLPAGKRMQTWDRNEVADGHELHEEPRLHVHWSPDENLQFSMELEVHQVEEYLADLKKEGGDMPYSISFYTPSLSREEAQKVIRVTKRARNAVFGADE